LVAPLAVTVNAVFLPGVNVEGDGVHVVGGGVIPDVQLNATELLYPLSAVALPLKIADCPTETVCGEFEIES
jgi:hypothetical protein